MPVDVLYVVSADYITAIIVYGLVSSCRPRAIIVLQAHASLPNGELANQASKAARQVAADTEVAIFFVSVTNPRPTALPISANHAPLHNIFNNGHTTQLVSMI